jgi:hypothetical protein
MGEPTHARRAGTRRSFIAGGLATTLVGLAGCAEKMPAPLPSANGRSLVLGPDPGFNPAALPADWFVAPPRGADRFKVVDVSGSPVLRVEAPGGPLLGRRLAMPLLATPYLHAGWYLDPGLYAGGPRDGLPRGLRLVVGFRGGTPGGAQLIDRVFTGDLPAYDRFIEFRLGGIGSSRPEEAWLELAAISDRGMRRVLRGPDRSQAGRWHVEALDLAAIYAGYWPRDRLAQVEIAFIAVGGLQHFMPPPENGSVSPAGYVAEILLTR